MTAVAEYIAALDRAHRRGDATEHSFRSFRTGGYQVLEKWLKDRKGRTLDIDDITHYRKVVLALSHTRQLTKEVDTAAVPLFEKSPTEEIA